MSGQGTGSTRENVYRELTRAANLYAEVAKITYEISQDLNLSEEDRAEYRASYRYLEKQHENYTDLAVDAGNEITAEQRSRAEADATPKPFEVGNMLKLEKGKIERREYSSQGLTDKKFETPAWQPAPPQGRNAGGEDSGEEYRRRWEQDRHRRDGGSGHGLGDGSPRRSGPGGRPR